MKLIPLFGARKSQGTGMYAMVDDADARYLEGLGLTWRPLKKPNGQIYARAIAPKRCKLAKHKSTLLLHRVLKHAAKGQEVDHINGQGLDCTQKNLRVCTRTQNARNVTKRNRECTTRCMGVSKVKASGHWVAQIWWGTSKATAKTRCLGSGWRTPQEASKAYNVAVRFLNPEFGERKLNQIPDGVTLSGNPHAFKRLINTLLDCAEEMERARLGNPA